MMESSCQLASAGDWTPRALLNDAAEAPEYREVGLFRADLRDALPLRWITQAQLCPRNGSFIQGPANGSGLSSQSGRLDRLASSRAPCKCATS
jgi:hypothetical protein